MDSLLHVDVRLDFKDTFASFHSASKNRKTCNHRSRFGALCLSNYASGLWCNYTKSLTPYFVSILQKIMMEVLKTKKQHHPHHMCLFVLHFVRQPCSKLDSRTLDEKEALPLHQISDFGAGEGVPLQHVFDKRPTLWSCPHTQFNRETSEDLVPEQEDENEEAEQGEGRQGTPMKQPQLPFRTVCVCTKEAIWTMTFIFVGASVTFSF